MGLRHDLRPGHDSRRLFLCGLFQTETGELIKCLVHTLKLGSCNHVRAYLNRHWNKRQSRTRFQATRAQGQDPTLPCLPEFFITTRLSLTPALSPDRTEEVRGEGRKSDVSRHNRKLDSQPQPHAWTAASSTSR